MTHIREKIQRKCDNRILCTVYLWRSWFNKNHTSKKNISWPTTAIKKSVKHCTLFFLRIFLYIQYSQRKTYEVPTRYRADTGKFFFLNFDFETVLPVSKTTAGRNFPELLRFVLCPTRYSVFCSGKTLIQSRSILSC